MGTDERIAALEEENQRLRNDNEKMLQIIAQMRVTLNRLVNRYITESR